MQPHAKTQLHLKRKLKLLTPVSLSSDSNPITEWVKKRVKKRALLGDFEVKARRLELRVCRFEKLSLDLCCISLLLSTKSARHTNTQRDSIWKWIHIKIHRPHHSSSQHVVTKVVCFWRVCVCFLLFCLLPWPWSRQPRRKNIYAAALSPNATQFIATAGPEGSLAQYQRLLSAAIITITPHQQLRDGIERALWFHPVRLGWPEKRATFYVSQRDSWKND